MPATTLPFPRYPGVQPRTGFPVQNQGGLPRNPVLQPPRPYLTTPTVGAPPGPEKMPASPNPNWPAQSGPLPTMMTGGNMYQPPAKPTGQSQPLPTMMTGGNMYQAPTGGPEPVPTAPGGYVPVLGSPTTVPGGTMGGLAKPATATAPTGPQGGGGTMEGLPTDLYGRSGGTTAQATPGSLEEQIRQFITGAMQGSVTPEFINRAQQQVFRNVQGQTRQGEQAINEDAIRRGLYRSGIPAESTANLRGQAQSAMATGVADILNQAEIQNIQGRQNAANVAGNLLGENRQWDQYTQQRIDAENARRAAEAGQWYDYIDPETGVSYRMSSEWF